MSLRRRFVILGLLATLAIGAAVVSIVQIFSRSDNAREQAGRDAADAMVSALASRETSVGQDEVALRDIATAIVASQTDAHAGFCPQGAMIAAASPGPRREPRRPELPPDQRDVVIA